MNHLPHKFSEFAQFFTKHKKETRVIRITKIGQHEVKIFLDMNLSYELIKAEDINDTTHVIVDFAVGICPFNVNNQK